MSSFHSIAHFPERGRWPVAGAILLAFVTCGCMDSLQEQATKDRGKSIIHQKTQDIGKYDPEAGLRVSDANSVADATDPISAPLAVYQDQIQNISKLYILHALRLYEAEHGHYPKDYDEFMSQIIKPNNIQLPQLPPRLKYQYDEEKHELVVVEAPQQAAPAEGADAQPADAGTE